MIEGDVLGLLIVALREINEALAEFDERIEDLESDAAGLPFPVEALVAYLDRVQVLLASIPGDEAAYLRQIAMKMITDINTGPSESDDGEDSVEEKSSEEGSEKESDDESA